jgi:curved DNA-binding protein CbpA
MSTPLPPDPYKALGVTKDAKLPEIRSAHRKLVLKCHPDKVQDAALKAKAVDEFHKIQQAYEILSDDVKRVQYDDRLKLEELRREMGRGMPHKQDPFEHQIRTDRTSDVNIRTAEFRPPTFARSKTSQPTPKVYSQTPPRSYEDVPSHYEEHRSARKTASYESADRKHASAREEKARRKEEDERHERERLRMEKELKRSGYGKKEKTRDRERKRGSDDKYSRAAYAESDSDDEPRTRHETRSSAKKETRYRDESHEEPLRVHQAPRAAPLAEKWDSHRAEAAAYMEASKRRVKQAPPSVPSVDEFRRESAPLKRAVPLQRAETSYVSSSNGYGVRHVPAQSYISDDESPRRSSAARKESRKSGESSSRKEKSSKDRSRRSSPNASYIVDDAPKKPSLQSYQSAPPVIPNSSAPREKPSRSQTQDYPRQESGPPPLTRPATFHVDSKRSDRSRERGNGTRLKQSHVVTDSGSEAESPRHQSHRRSHSPAPRSSPRVAQEYSQTQHRYVVQDGKTQRVDTRHRDELRNLDDEYAPRGRESSPPGRRGSREERPAAVRTHSSSQTQPVRGIPIRSATNSGYTYPSEPIIREARPAGPVREAPSYRSSSRSAKPIYGEVKYATAYTPDNVIYTPTPPAVYNTRRTREPETYSSRDYYQQPSQSRRSEVSY